MHEIVSWQYSDGWSKRNSQPWVFNANHLGWHITFKSLDPTISELCYSRVTARGVQFVNLVEGDYLVTKMHVTNRNDLDEIAKLLGKDV